MKYIAASTFEEVVRIDGLANEKFWGKAKLDSLTRYVIYPEKYTFSDYKVYFKAAYDYTNFYCMAFVTDDKMLRWDASQIYAWQSKTKNGYIIEMQLSWDIIIDRSLAEAPTIEPGTQIPWDINGCDADDPVIRRDLISSWSAGWDMDWTDNSQYGILELGDDQVSAINAKDNKEIQLIAISNKTFNLKVNKPVKTSEVVKVYDTSGKIGISANAKTWRQRDKPEIPVYRNLYSFHH